MAKFKLDDGLWETETKMPLFHTLVKTYMMQENDLSPTARQQEILASLERLPSDLQQDIRKYGLEYFRKIDSLVNLAEEGRTINEHEIEEHFRIKSVLIPEIRNCQTNFLFLSFDCDWEEEHGLQLLIADGRIIISGAHTSLPFSAQWSQAISMPGKQQQIDFLKALPIHS